MTRKKYISEIGEKDNFGYKCVIYTRLYSKLLIFKNLIH